MKIRSKPLYTYLLDSGVLNGTPEEIDCAKCAYRRIYKQQWKQRKRPRNEIRIEFTLKQYATIKSKAIGYGLNPTSFSRNITLASVELTPVIPNKDILLQVLQLISMAAIASEKNISSRQLSAQLAHAEKLLLTYVTV